MYSLHFERGVITWPIVLLNAVLMYALRTAVQHPAVNPLTIVVLNLVLAPVPIAVTLMLMAAVVG